MRVILAKPGLDGHDRGIKVIAMALRDAGVEVVYLGPRCSPAAIAAAVIEEDPDVVGISVLSGAHIELTEQLLEALRASGSRVPLVVGGTIPDSDARSMIELGVADVLSVGAPLDEVVSRIIRLAGEPAAKR